MLAAPVEDAKKPQQRTSRVIETLGSREVCFLNDDGEIEQIDANVDDHTNRTVTQRVKDYASGTYRQRASLDCNQKPDTEP